MNPIEQLVIALRAAQVASRLCRKPLYLTQDREGTWRPSEHPWAGDAQIVVDGDSVRVMCDACTPPLHKANLIPRKLVIKNLSSTLDNTC